MSIEQTGPKAYDYQYLITLDMTLSLLEYEELRVQVENESFEDAELSYHYGENTFDIDLQVKQRDKEISFEEFCKWLVHFNKRGSELFILEKLQKTSDNYLIFVTNNRCMDQVSRFLCNDDICENLTESKASFSESYLQELREMLIVSADGKTALEKRRCAHVKEFLACTSNAELRKALKKVFILERKEEQSVEDKIKKRLKCSYFIPESECETILETLLSVVESGRDTGENIVSELRNVIEKKSLNRILPCDDKYCKRELFETLRAHLTNKHVLLLTGVPLSGKTYLAKAIAQDFQEKGYLIKHTENIADANEVYHFMCAPDNDQRLLLLEDPFGYVQMMDKASSAVGNILKMIRENVNSNRKLIITTRKDILFEAYRKSDLNSCKIMEHIWWDVSVNSINEAEAVWKECYGESEESMRIFKAIDQDLAQNEAAVFLEIGEIRHLYTEISDIAELKEVPIQDIIAMARVSAEEVYRKISGYSEEFRKLFILLGCFCNTIKTISLCDLAYILAGTDEDVSGRNRDDEPVSVTCGGSEREEKEEFPVYRETPQLDGESVAILRELCRLGYLYRNPVSKEISFAHPIYFYASKMMLDSELDAGWYSDEIIGYLKIAIGSLSRNAAICCLQCLQQSFECNETIIPLILKGSNSIFPAVRDLAVRYMDQNFDLLDENTQKEFFENIMYIKTVERYMQWNGEECWYQKSNSFHRHFFDFLRKKPCLTVEEINFRLEKEETFSKKEIYDTLYSRWHEVIPFGFLSYALLCDEAVIRSKAMYYIFSQYNGEQGQLKEKYLTQYENYNVVYGILKGVLSNWKAFGNSDRQLLIAYFKEQLHRKSVAFYMKSLFEKFGDEDDSEVLQWENYTAEERKELWELWAVLITEWLKCFPAKFVSMDEPHMSYTMNISLKHLKNQGVLIEVGKAWLQWLKEYFRYQRADDYGMSVMEYIVEGTEGIPELREGIIETALMEENSNIAASHIKHLINCWKMLSDAEKNSVCRFLASSERIDYKWMLAVAIVQKQVPEEVLETILGNKKALESTSNEFMLLLESKGILEECLSMYCGFPQPLWYNGYHHNAPYKFWDTVIMEVLKRGKADRCYYIALREFIDALYNKETYRFNGGYAFYKDLLQQPLNRQQIFERLGYCLTQNQDNKPMWNDLLAAATEEEKEGFFHKLSNYIELVENKDIGYRSSLSEFDDTTLKKYLLPLFPEDENIIKLSESIVRAYKILTSYQAEEDDECIKKLQEIYPEVIRKLYDETPPRLLLTNKFVKAVAKRMTVQSEEVESILNKSEERYWNRYELVKKNFEENCPLEIEDEYKLENWME